MAHEFINDSADKFMTLPMRFELPNALYHVMSRGNGGEIIFVEGEDKQHSWI